MKNKLFSAAVALLLLAASVQAQTPAPRNIQQSERARIRQGVASGELTRSEAARLHAREAGITADKRAARANGVVTPGEHREIRGDERRASRAIYRQKYDAQVR